MLKINVFFNLILLACLSASVGASIWLAYELDPSESSLNVAWFLLATGMAVTSLAGLIFFLSRQRFGIKEEVRRNFVVSVRQGALVGLAYVIAMALQSKDLFSWLNAGFLVMALAFLEGYFIYNDRKSKING